MPASRPSLRDVAARAGTSVSLVSHAINGTGRVSAATRTRILRAADDLGYRGNRHARLLRTGRRVDIGVVIRNLRNPLFLDILTAMEEQARRDGRAVLVTHSRYELDEQQELLDHLVELGVGSIVIAPVGGAEPLETWMAAHPDIAVVALNLDMGTAGTASGPGVGGALSTVNPDHDDAVGAAVGHFALRGHREIAFVAGPQGSIADAAREQAFQRECARRGIRARMLRSPLDPDSVGGLIADDLRRRVVDRPAARPAHPCYLLNSDLLASVVYAKAAEQGLRIGKDVSVIGHDDLPTSAILDPGLTTIAFDRARLGVEALRLIREGVTEHVVLPVTLRERDSVATVG